MITKLNTSANIIYSLRARVSKRASGSARWHKNLLGVPRALHLFGLVVLLPFSSGCSSLIENTRVHRPLTFGQVEKVEDKLPASERAIKDDGKSYEPAKIGQRPNTYLGIIEFTDQGMLREPKQLFDTTAFIKNKLSEQPLVLVIFVHGWNNNASPSNGNLRQFRRILLELKPESGAKNIVGVYLGWPGNVRMLPYVSYFSRLNAAERVGRVTCTEVMLSLIAHAKLVNNNGGSGVRQQVKTIVIGHSMGGLIVEKAFLQAMIGYGLTNAATSDQLDALKNAQKAAFAMHLANQTKAENVCAVNHAARPDAQRDVRLADADFKSYSDKSDSLKWQHDACLTDLKNFKDLTRYLCATAEQLSKDLHLVAQDPSHPELRDTAARAADVLFHTNANVAYSIHHLLEGLAGWAASPESEVDRTRRDEFLRETPEGYLSEMRSNTPAGIVMADNLREPLLKAIRQKEVGGNSSLSTRLEDFLDVPPFIKADAREKRSVGAFVQEFQGAWENYIQARKEWNSWESTANFTRLKKQYDQANYRLNEIDHTINVAKKQIEDSLLAQAEVAELEGKLDLVRERPPADLILLINSASEALVTEQMRQVWQDERGGMLLRKMWRNRDTRPWIISISSKYDPATRIIYPIAMSLSSLFRGAASPSERVWMTHSAPHVRETHGAPDVHKMITHEVRRKRKIEDLKVRPKEKSANLELVDVRPKGVTHTPLWVVDADTEIKEHNIVTKNLVELVPFLLREAEVLKTVKANGD